jgi:hypothetical protein
MKFEKWTVALAALGVVSLGSAVRAEETATTAVSAMTPTTIGGYVDTSAHWNFGTGNANPAPYKFNTASKADGFNLDVVQVTLEKALDEQPWSAGYHVDLWAGPDANTLGTTLGSGANNSDFAIRQAYISLNTPIGNGLDWKVGVFDSIIGYESVEGPSNPNYTRSYGHSMEPQTETGVLARYRFCDCLSASVGVADTMGPMINQRATPNDAESYKTYMASLMLTAPGSMGFLAGSTLFGGFVNGFDSRPIHPGVAGYANGDNQTSFYVGSTIATPIKELSFGAAFDYVNVYGMGGETFSLAGYTSYKATDKLSFHFRGEYVKDTIGLFAEHYDANGNNGVNTGTPGAVDVDHSTDRIMAYTLTAQYDLWKNVISRVELRWDHSLGNREAFGGTEVGSPTLANSWLLAANMVYKF